MKLYTGIRALGNHVISVVEPDGTYRPLAMRPDLSRLGYDLKGRPALALAILADLCGDAVALRHWHEFWRQVLTSLAWDHWYLTEPEVRARLADSPRLPEASAN